ncbi:hypothetical protein ACVWY5_001479 [Bradyrhizobium sp. USDA 3256]
MREAANETWWAHLGHAVRAAYGLLSSSKTISPTGSKLANRCASLINSVRVF